MRSTGQPLSWTNVDVLLGDVAELISVDNGTVAQGQNTCEYGETICMQDSAGPFDWHLTRHLLALCGQHRIEHGRDVFRDSRSDAAAARQAGNDLRTARVCFGLDASHGHERVHIDSSMALAESLRAQVQSRPRFKRDAALLGPLADFPTHNDPTQAEAAAARADPRGRARPTRTNPPGPARWLARA
ncbi:hypothetical protein [Caldimonas manganoxidans]|uniref:hypothetical protein n=1 Tax=Caldimonas manganoxidans TaxID=196015 RepID=UPI001FDF7689|nr:hypothetical protein [Caldimonas manganoxidans]